MSNKNINDYSEKTSLDGTENLEMQEAAGGLGSNKRFSLSTLSSWIQSALSGVYASITQGAKADSAVQSVVAGSNITVDSTDPNNPIVNGQPSGVQSVVAGSGISVDSTDTANPIVTNTGIRSIVAGDNVTIDTSDPYNPVIASTGGGGGSTSSIQRANVYHGSNYTTTGGTAIIKPTWDTVEEDTGSLWDSTNQRYNIVSSGYYYISYHRRVSGLVLIQPLIAVNAITAPDNTTTKIQGVHNVSSYDDEASGILYLSAGDYVEAWHYQDANRTLFGGLTYAGFRLIGPLGGSSSGRTLLGSVTASALSTSLSISGLSISNGQTIEIEGEILNSTSTTGVSIAMYFNGDTTNANYTDVTQYVDSSAGGTRQVSSAYIAALNASSSTSLNGELRKGVDSFPRTVVRTARGNLGSSFILQNFVHIWNGTADIVSLTFTSSTANAIGIGSYINVYAK